MNKIYNEDIKEQFLSTYDNVDTQKTLRHVFHKSFLVESILDKDLYNFNLEQIGKCIANASPHNAQTARSIGRFISSYISWAIEAGLRNTNLDPIKGIDPSWYEQFIDKKKVHFSYSEFIDLLESLPNGQDQAFLMIQWHGISGRSFSEIRNLKKSDLNFDTNEIYVEERDKTIKLDDDCMKYLKKAVEQRIYYTWSPKSGDYNEKELVESEYLMRNVKSPRTSAQQINGSVLYTRLNSIKEDKDILYLTPNSMKQSGMIKMAADLYEEYGKLDYEQFAIIGEKYNYATVKAPSGEYFNTTLMREFISQNNLKELYNIDIQF